MTRSPSRVQKTSNISFVLIIFAFMLILLGALGTLFVNPNLAFAKILSPSVTAVAEVQTDGSLHVSEQRQFVFDDEYRSIWWPITGLGDKNKIEGVSIRAARIDEAGEVKGEWITFREVSFQTLWRDALAESQGLSRSTPTATGPGSKAGVQTSDDIAVPGYYAFAVDNRDNAIYAFFPSNEEPMVFAVDYTISDTVRSFDDVAELYWDYAPVRKNVETLDMHVSIRLPVPEGVPVIPGENVFAWGHGPNGTIDIKEDGTISIEIPKIKPGQYGQAHIIFPVSWLSNLSIMQRLDYSGTRLDNAKAEEETWSDTWSYWQINTYLFDIIMLSACFIVVVAALLLYLKFGRRFNVEEHQVAEKADFLLGKLEEANTELPRFIDIDPAAAGRIHRWNHESASDFIAMIMGMTYSGVVTANAMRPKDPLGTDAEIRLRVAASAKEHGATPLGAETMRLLFDVCGEGYQSISTDEIVAFAKKHPQIFSEEMTAWQKTLSTDVGRIKVFDPTSFKLQRAFYATTAIMALLGLGFAFIGGNALLAFAFILAALTIGILGNYAPRRTAYGERVERMIEVLLNKACASEHVSEDVAKVLLPYAFAHERTQELFAKLDDPTEVEVVWFKPGVVRFKQAPPLAKRLSCTLEEIALRPDKASSK